MHICIYIVSINKHTQQTSKQASKQANKQTSNQASNKQSKCSPLTPIGARAVGVVWVCLAIPEGPSQEVPRSKPVQVHTRATPAQHTTNKQAGKQASPTIIHHPSPSITIHICM